jgi:TP901 family phage tail tape measure protein
MTGALSVGTLVGSLELEDNLTPAMAKAANQVDTLGPKISRLGDQLNVLGYQTDQVGRHMTRLGDRMTLLSAPITAIAVASGRLATQFESNMVKLINIAGVSEEAMRSMREEVLRMAGDVGKGPIELSKALYNIASVGFRGADALEILDRAAKASAIGLGTTADVAKGVVAAIQAYGKESMSAAQATDTLLVAVREGGAEADEFARTLGRVVGTANLVGISFAEVTASVATFTRLGVRADEAVTALRGTMSVLLKPSDEAREQLEALGTSVERLRDKVKKDGLADALVELVKLAKDDADAIGAIIPNVRALAGVLANANSQADAYRSIVLKATAATGELDESYKRLEQTTAQKLAKSFAALQVAMERAGERILPFFVGVIEAATPLFGVIEKIGTAFDSLPAPLQTATVALGAFAIALGPILSITGRLVEVFGMLIGERGIAALTRGMNSLNLSTLALTTQTYALAAAQKIQIATMALLGPGFAILNRTMETLAFTTVPALVTRFTQLEIVQRTSAFATGLMTAAKLRLAGVILALQINVSTLVARIGALEIVQNASVFASNAMAAAKLRLAAVLLAAQLNVATLAARFGLLTATMGSTATASGVLAGALSAVGTAMSVLAAATIIVGALVALGAAAIKAAEGVTTLWQAWKEGHFWAKLWERDTDNWVRRMIGLGDGANQAADAFSEAAMKSKMAAAAAAQLESRMTGSDVQKQLFELGDLFEKLDKAGKNTPDILRRIADEAKRLQDAGANVGPAFRKLIDQFAGGSTSLVETTRSLTPFSDALKDVDTKLAALSATTKKELTLGALNFGFEDFAKKARRIPEAAKLGEDALRKFFDSVNDTAKAGEKVTNWVENLRISAKKLESQLQAGEAQNVPMLIILEEYENLIGKIVNRSKLLGDAIMPATARAHLEIAAKNMRIFNSEVEKANNEARRDIIEQQIEKVKRQADLWIDNAKAIRDSERAIADYQNQFQPNTLANQIASINLQFKRQIEDLPIIIEDIANYQDRIGMLRLEADANIAATTEAWLRGSSKTRVELEALAQDAMNRYEAMAASGRFAAKDIQKAWEDMINANMALQGKWTMHLVGWLESIPRLVEQALTGGGGGKGFAKALGSMIFGDIGRGLFEPGGMFGNFTKGLIKGEGFIGKIFGETFSKALGLAMPVIGEALGALAGFAIEKLIDALHNPEWEKVVKDVGRDWGVSISEELAKSIAEESKKIGRMDAPLLFLKEIIDEAGGLGKFGLENAIQRSRQLFSAIERGSLTSKQAAEELASVFPDLSKAMTDTGKLASKEFLELISLTNRFGLEVQAVTDHIISQAGRFAAGLDKMMGPLKKSFDEAEKKLQEFDEAADKIRFGAPGGSEAKGIFGNTDLLSSAQRKQLDELDKKWDEQRDKIIALQPEIERFGRLAVAAFNAAKDQGLSTSQAINAIGPALDTLIPMYERLGKLGIESNNAALTELLAKRQLIGANKELLEAAAALNDTTLALSHLNGLNAATLADLESQGLQTYDRLREAGFSEVDALSEIDDWLETIIKAHKDLGIPIDENTQKLIDLADQHGLIGDEAMSMNDILIEGFSALIEAVGGKLPEAFKKFRDAGVAAAADVADAIDDIPTSKRVNIEVPEGWEPWREDWQRPPRDVDVAMSGGFVRQNRVLGFAGGGQVPKPAMAPSNFGRLLTFEPKGTDTVPAMLTPGEVVLSEKQQTALVRRIEEPRPVAVKESSSAPQVTVQNYFSLEGAKIRGEEDARTLALAFAEILKRGGEVRTIVGDELISIIRQRAAS